jgi:heat shock protein HslJ
MRRLLTALLLLTLLAGCSKDEQLDPGDLYGLWKFRGYGSHLADVSFPAARLVWQAKNAPTLVLESKGDEIGVSGQSVVNAYFGTARRRTPLPNRVVGYEAEFVTLGSTKAAGTPDQMEREQAYFGNLQQLKSLYIYRQPFDNYDELLWMTSETEYLSFIRKR